MTPEKREQMRQDLIEYAAGTIYEWMRLIDLKDGEEDTQYRIAWEEVTGGVMIANVKEVQGVDPIARFRLQLQMETLPDLPPIGPEDDPALIEGQRDLDAGLAYCMYCKGVGCSECHEVGSWAEPEKPFVVTSKALKSQSAPFDPDYPGCAPETCGGSKLDPCRTVLRTKGLYHDDDAEWVPATFSACLAGDRIRIGDQETEVWFSSVGEWHANNADPYRPTRWDHQELILDLAANPGRHQYPLNTSCEILMTPERKAVFELQQQFPGSAVIS